MNCDDQFGGVESPPWGEFVDYRDEEDGGGEHEDDGGDLDDDHDDEDDGGDHDKNCFVWSIYIHASIGIPLCVTNTNTNTSMDTNKNKIFLSGEFTFMHLLGGHRGFYCSPE